MRAIWPLLFLIIAVGHTAVGQETLPTVNFLESEFSKASDLSEEQPEEAIPILLALRDDATEANDSVLLCKIIGLLGNCHYYLSDDKSALAAWQEAYGISQNNGDKESMASLLNNLGNGYAYISDDSSLLFYNRSIALYTELGMTDALPDMYGNISFTYYDNIGQPDSAYKYALKALRGYSTQNDSVGICSMWAQLGRVLTDLGKPDSALYWAKKALPLARELKSTRIEEPTLDALRFAYYSLGNHEKAYEYSDSLVNFILDRNEVERLALVTEMEAQHEVQMKEKEIEALEQQKADVDRENTRQRVVIVSSILGLIMLMFLGFSTIKEKRRSDELLLNILPHSVAEELKKTGKATAQRYESVTVLFTDFVDFSKVSEQVSAEVLVEMIDEYFSAFDKIISTYGLEKVKTIGDSYMAAGGIPEPTAEHAAQVVQAALEMQQHVAALKRRKSKEGKPYFDTRIGVHTGSVVAGVVGIKKFAYDIWGDTVNIAARLEKASEAGKVNISEKTYDLVKDRFNCTHRGKIPIKNLGEIDMYFVG